MRYWFLRMSGVSGCGEREERGGGAGGGLNGDAPDGRHAIIPGVGPREPISPRLAVLLAHVGLPRRIQPLGRHRCAARASMIVLIVPADHVAKVRHVAARQERRAKSHDHWMTSFEGLPVELHCLIFPRDMEIWVLCGKSVAVFKSSICACSSAGAVRDFSGSLRDFSISLSHVAHDVERQPVHRR